LWKIEVSKSKKTFEPKGVTIDYEALGTINIDELAHALLEDIQALKDIYHVQYVKGPQLRIYPTNEYGEPVQLVRPEGGKISFMDTHHYRPACKDYDL
jgi:hypothetical protein